MGYGLESQSSILGRRKNVSLLHSVQCQSQEWQRHTTLLLLYSIVFSSEVKNGKDI
jgi:hypothetical protein